MNRREFLEGAVSAAASYAVRPVWAETCEPIMRFGVASDVHVRVQHPLFDARDSLDNHVYLEKALRRFDELKVDAVVLPGDISDIGLIAEFELFAEVWNRVFPGCRAADGRKVELIAVTGNHDIGQWPGLWDRLDDAAQRKYRFDHPANLRREWKRLFGEEWSLVSRRDVKGIAFVTAQFSRLHPPVEAYFREHAADLPTDRPFFFVQHAHPFGTCFGDDRCGRGLWDKPLGVDSAKALSRFPNAVALTGHSHNSPVDGRSVWQGAFTSINCGSTWGAGLMYFDYDNALIPCHPDYRKQRMEWLVPLENAGRSCLVVDVHADRLVVHRWCLSSDEPLGEDWVVPLPATEGGPFDFRRIASRRRASGAAPQFAADAVLRVRQGVAGSSLAGPRLKGRRCWEIVIPPARPVGGARVFDYVVEAKVGGTCVARSQVVAAGFCLPPGKASVETVVLFGEDEIPAGAEVVFSVTPRDCYHVAGRSLTRCCAG